MLRTITASQINDESLKKPLVLSLDDLSLIRTSDIQSACLLNSMSIREASYLLAFHLCPFGNSYLTAHAPKIGPKSNINHLDAPIKLSWGMMLVGKD